MNPCFRHCLIKLSIFRRVRVRFCRVSDNALTKTYLVTPVIFAMKVFFTGGYKQTNK